MPPIRQGPVLHVNNIVAICIIGAFAACAEQPGPAYRPPLHTPHEASGLDVLAPVLEASGVVLPELPDDPGPQRLLPAVENGMRFAARVDVERESSLRVVRGQSAMSSTAREHVSTSLVIHIIDGSKWGVSAFEITFDSVTVDGGGWSLASLGPAGPRPGETWTCRSLTDSYSCVDNLSGSERSLPAWVPVSLVRLMPGAPVSIGESWTRSSVAPMFALPGRADADAALQLRGRVVGDQALDIVFEFDGEAEDTAYGRVVPLRVVGEGNVRFVPGVEEVSEFAWSWTADGVINERLGGIETRAERTRRLRLEAALLRL